jgi:hypothetical protein
MLKPKAGTKIRFQRPGGRAQKRAKDYVPGLLPCQCARNCSRKTAVGGRPKEIVGEKSPWHSSTKRGQFSDRHSVLGRRLCCRLSLGLAFPAADQTQGIRGIQRELADRRLPGRAQRDIYAAIAGKDNRL